MGPEAGPYQEVLNRLLDGLKEDIGALREGQSDTDRIARDAYNKIGEIERRMGNVEKDSKDATISLVELKTLAKNAGSVWGAVMGVLCSVLVAFILRAMHIP